MESVRSAHVDFVSNHNGSYPSDILLATISGPVSVALTSVVLPFLLPVRYALLTYSSKLWIHLLIETITVICPFLISFTLMSNYSQLNLLLLLLLVFSLMIFSPQLWRVHLPNLNQLFALPLPEKKPPFITNYRAGLNLATCICILAVDFQVFPRRFAKTETYGFSLMDVGVGSFVIANGLVGTSQIPQIQFFTKTLPILLLGVGRLLAVKLSNYHEHITEYGLHWNFFFTLAFVKTISAVITQRYRPLTIAGSLLLVYELLLKLGLESWIISDYPRSNLLSANREGIFSLFGYLAIYYASLELGNYLKKPRNSFGDWFRLLGDLCCLCALSWIGLQLSQSIFGEPSRRLANASFCIWMMIFNMAMMSCYLLVDLLLVAFDLHRDDETSTIEHTVFREPYLLRFINFNGLSFFLLANLLTGLINGVLDTIHTSWPIAMLILFGYCLILSFSVAGMYLWRVRL